MDHRVLAHVLPSGGPGYLSDRSDDLQVLIDLFPSHHSLLLVIKKSAPAGSWKPPSLLSQVPDYFGVQPDLKCI